MAALHRRRCQGDSADRGHCDSAGDDLRDESCGGQTFQNRSGPETGRAISQTSACKYRLRFGTRSRGGVRGERSVQTDKFIRLCRSPRHGEDLGQGVVRIRDRIEQSLISLSASRHR
jgi:hypothetical protein